MAWDKKPAFWIRYIDDIFGIWSFDESSLSRFHAFVNSVYLSIKVTLTSNFSSVDFLGLRLYKSLNRVSFSVAFKPTHSFNLLSPDSFHPVHVLKNRIFHFSALSLLHPQLHLRRVSCH